MSKTPPPNFPPASPDAVRTPFLSRLRVRLIGLVLLAILPALGLVVYTGVEQRRQVRLEADGNARRVVKLASYPTGLARLRRTLLSRPPGILHVEWSHPPALEAPLWARLASFLYEHGEKVYNFQGLRAFKGKFDPVWEPRYLAYPGGLALPRVLADVAALIAGGYRRIFLK